MRTSGQKDNFPTKLGRKADAITRAEGSSVGSASTTTGAGLRAKPKGLDEPPDPTVRASFQNTTVVVGAELTTHPYPPVTDVAFCTIAAASTGYVIATFEKARTYCQRFEE